MPKEGRSEIVLDGSASNLYTGSINWPSTLEGAAMVMTTIVHDQAGIHVSYYGTVKRKEGIMDLSFADPADEGHVQPDDKLEIVGLDEYLNVSTELKVLLHHRDGTSEELPCIAC